MGDKLIPNIGAISTNMTSRFLNLGKKKENAFLRKSFVEKPAACKTVNTSPRSLLNATWWLVSQHFGLRGCQEHCTMNVDE